ncbi:MAG TPA: transcriptional repressor [Planktothrix sp.]|jgi:Fur family ferric uptake transcriptional regulator
MWLDKSSQLRLNRGCSQVLEALDHSDKLSSAHQIHARLRDVLHNDAPGLTTIYRSLELLAKLNLVQAVQIEGEKRYERIVPGEHHHHLICTSCQANIHLDQCFIEQFSDKVHARHDFLVKGHILEIFGLCAACKSVTEPQQA